MGRIRNPAAKAPKEAIRETEGSSAGKNKAAKTGAKKP
jgi:hypothetical protein